MKYLIEIFETKPQEDNSSNQNLLHRTVIDADDLLKRFGIAFESCEEIMDLVREKKISRFSELQNIPAENIKAKVSEYVQAGGSFCPECGSRNITCRGDWNADGLLVTTTVDCDSCDHEWGEVYTLTDLTDA